MTDFNWTGSDTTAIVFLAGFAIQQALQIIDPFITFLLYSAKKKVSNEKWPESLTDADLKKAAMALMSFLCGMLVVYLTNIRLLSILNTELKGIGDFLVSSLVVGTGTEAVNTVLKFMGYVKDAQKPTPTPEISIAPTTVTVKQNMTFQFTATLSNTSLYVTWKVLHGNGGTITDSGLYTAPATPGTYQVQATSGIDRSKYAIATVTVVA